MSVKAQKMVIGRTLIVLDLEVRRLEEQDQRLDLRVQHLEEALPLRPRDSLMPPQPIAASEQNLHRMSSSYWQLVELIEHSCAAPKSAPFADQQ